MMDQNKRIPSTRDLLGQYTVILNTHGVDSLKASQFIEEHKTNEEFVELAETARWLKKAIVSGSSASAHCER